MDVATFVQSEFANERLCLPRCAACGRAHWYPRAFCPFCFGAEIHWTTATGEATVYSFSISNTQPPLVIAYVTLAEGPAMMSNLVDIEPGQVAIGMSVKVAWRPCGDGELQPFFAPRDAADSRLA